METDLDTRGAPWARAPEVAPVRPQLNTPTMALAHIYNSQDRIVEGLSGEDYEDVLAGWTEIQRTFQSEHGTQIRAWRAGLQNPRAVRHVSPEARQGLQTAAPNAFAAQVLEDFGINLRDIERNQNAPEFYRARGVDEYASSILAGHGETQPQQQMARDIRLIYHNMKDKDWGEAVRRYGDERTQLQMTHSTIAASLPDGEEYDALRESIDVRSSQAVANFRTAGITPEVVARGTDAFFQHYQGRLSAEETEDPQRRDQHAVTSARFATNTMLEISADPVAAEAFKRLSSTFSPAEIAGYLDSQSTIGTTVSGLKALQGTLKGIDDGVAGLVGVSRADRRTLRDSLVTIAAQRSGVLPSIDDAKVLEARQAFTGVQEGAQLLNAVEQRAVDLGTFTQGLQGLARTQHPGRPSEEATVEFLGSMVPEESRPAVEGAARTLVRNSTMPGADGQPIVVPAEAQAIRRMARGFMHDESDIEEDLTRRTLPHDDRPPTALPANIDEGKRAQTLFKEYRDRLASDEEAVGWTAQARALYAGGAAGLGRDLEIRGVVRSAEQAGGRLGALLAANVGAAQADFRRGSDFEGTQINLIAQLRDKTMQVGGEQIRVFDVLEHTAAGREVLQEVLSAEPTPTGPWWSGARAREVAAVSDPLDRFDAAAAIQEARETGMLYISDKGGQLKFDATRRREPGSEAPAAVQMIPVTVTDERGRPQQVDFEVDFSNEASAAALFDVVRHGAVYSEAMARSRFEYMPDVLRRDAGLTEATGVLNQHNLGPDSLAAARAGGGRPAMRTAMSNAGAYSNMVNAVDPTLAPRVAEARESEIAHVRQRELVQLRHDLTMASQDAADNRRAEAAQARARADAAMKVLERGFVDGRMVMTPSEYTDAVEMVANALDALRAFAE